VSWDSLSAQGPGLLVPLFAAMSDAHSLLYTSLPAGTHPDPVFLRDIREAGGEVLSGEGFRQIMAETVGADILRFCLLTIGAVVLAAALAFRSPSRCLAVLAPMLTALACSLALFRAAGVSVNMFHAVALPLVIALSIDYGIFMQAVIEGRMDRHGAKAVLLCALTTLAGFGALLLARHPALFSLGFAVTAGIGAALAAALLLQPLFFRLEGEICLEV
jgi:predicted exporter